MGKKHDYGSLLKYMRMLEDGYSIAYIHDKFSIRISRLTYLGLLVKIVDKIRAVFVYWSKLVDKCGYLPAFSTCI